MTNKSRLARYISHLGAGFMLVALLLIIALPAMGAVDIQVMVDGQEIDYGDAPPVVMNDRAYVGVRSLALALGVLEDRIQWNAPTQTVSLSKDNTIVVLILDNTVMQVNDGIVRMDVAPVAINNRTYLPARYVAEAFGFTVEWNEDSQQALIQSATPEESNDTINTEPEASLVLSSTSFTNDAVIPIHYAAESAGGQNISPALAWAHAPEETQSFALLMYDTDAGNWLHWGILNIPAEVTEFPEGASLEGMPDGCVQLFNESDHQALYWGPSPPTGSGVHNYIITLFALDTEALPPANGFERYDSLISRIEPHVIKTAVYHGTYSQQ